MIRLRGIWLAIALCGPFWVCGTGAHMSMRASHWIVLLIALGLCSWSLRDIRELRLSPWLLSLGWLFVPMAIVFGFPFSLFCWMAVASSLLLMTSQHLRLGRSVGLGTAALAAILGIQTIAWPAIAALASRYHAAAWLARPVAWVLQALGLAASASDGVVHIQTFHEVVNASPTWEGLGMIPALQMLIPFVVFALAFHLNIRRLLVAVAVFLAYLFVRYCVVLVIYVNAFHTRALYDPIFLTLTFLPLAFVWSAVVGVKVPIAREAAPPPSFDKRLKWAAALAFVAVFSLVFAFTFADPGHKKPGRLIIDEGHSDWEWTTKPYDIHWYGQASGYNYWCLSQYLDHFYDVTINSEPLTGDLLAECDVLVLKTPTSPYSEEEIAAVEKFVRSGGGCFLIGDHTNVFGITTNLNPLARRFGLAFSYDATYDLNTGGLSVYDSPTVFPHPIVQDMPRFLFGTSCSMANSLASRNVMTGYGLSALQADYSQKNFFPQAKHGPQMEFGLFTQSTALKHGRGRVAAFTDSTVFSNFWMFMPGKPELFLGTCGWLNRRNAFGWVNLFAGCIGLVALAAWVALVRVYPAWIAGLCLGISLALALFAAALVIGAVNRHFYSTPTPNRAITYVDFESDHSDFTLPSESLNPGMPLDKHYHTFYVWPQRLGLIPRVARDGRAFDGDGLAVIINPTKSFIPDDIAAVENHVEQGGRLLLLDGPLNRASTANELLSAFGLRIDHHAIGSKRLFEEGVASKESEGRLTVSNAYSVEGGTPMLRSPEGAVVLTRGVVGKGEVVVFCGSHTFSDAEMGVTGTIPNDAQKEFYRLQFWLLDNLTRREAASSWTPIPELHTIFQDTSTTADQ